MPSEAVVNSSPLIGLDKIASLGLLGRLYDKVWVPRQVLEEIGQGPGGQLLAEYLTNQEWVVIAEVLTVPDEIKSWDLGKGESSVIALGVSNPEIELIIDDRAGARCARFFGLKTNGLLGVLLTAKQKGIIMEISPKVTALIDAGFWISEKVRAEVLKQAGEKG